MFCKTGVRIFLATDFLWRSLLTCHVSWALGLLFVFSPSCNSYLLGNWFIEGDKPCSWSIFFGMSKPQLPVALEFMTGQLRICSNHGWAVLKKSRKNTKAQKIDSHQATDDIFNDMCCSPQPLYQRPFKKNNKACLNTFVFFIQGSLVWGTTPTYQLPTALFGENFGDPWRPVKDVSCDDWKLPWPNFSHILLNEVIVFLLLPRSLSVKRPLPPK